MTETKKIRINWENLIVLLILLFGGIITGGFFGGLLTGIGLIYILKGEWGDRI